MTRSPSASAVVSTRKAAFRSSGRKDVPSLGSTSSAPSRIAAAADLADDLARVEGRRELLPQARAALCNPVDQAFRHELVQDGQRDGADEGRAVPGVPVLEVLGAGRHRLVHVLAAQDPGERGVAGREPLAERDDVRLERQRVAREPRSGSAEPGHDLVEADQEAVLAPAAPRVPSRTASGGE